MLVLPRLDDSAAGFGHDQAGLAALLERGVTQCTAALASPDASLSLGASSKMLYLRARFYVRQRELSNALTDLAFAVSLNPLDDRVYSLHVLLETQPAFSMLPAWLALTSFAASASAICC